MRAGDPVGGDVLARRDAAGRWGWDAVGAPRWSEPVLDLAPEDAALLGH